MTDIFSEVDEEIRQERYKKLWDRFGVWIIILVLLIIAGTAGYRGWLYWNERAGQQDGDRYLAAIELVREGEFLAAQQAFDALGDAHDGYVMLSQLQSAANLAANDELRAGAESFLKAANMAGFSPEIRDLARLRAAYLLMEIGDYETVLTQVKTLEKGSLRYLAFEAGALASWKMGDLAGARRFLEQITLDAESPFDIRARADTLIRTIAPLPE